MAFASGKDTVVLLDEFNLSAYLSSADVNDEIAALETTTYGKSAKTRIMGLRDGSVSLTGFWDGAASAVDEVLAAATAGTEVLTIGPVDDTIGNRAKLAKAARTSYRVSDPVDGLVGVTADIQAADGGVESGVWLHALGIEVGAADGAQVDNGAATTDGGVAHLHVTAVAGFTNATIIIEHSTTGAWLGEETTLASFAQVTAISAERVEIAAGTTVKQYVRAALTVLTGTSITFAVALARR